VQQCTGATRPAVKTEGIADLLTQHPGVKVRVDAGYQGLASAFAEQVTAPPRKPAKHASAELVAALWAGPDRAVLPADPRGARDR
jgi:hypothetical protein